MRHFILLFFLIVFSIGCQNLPTKVVSQDPRIADGKAAEKMIQSAAVILDARPAFEFNLAHVPGAINVRWEDFTQGNARARGLLEKDSFALARRLALIGIDPDTKVLVLGKGLQGSGEEGRIAWTLNFLGVHDVRTFLYTSFRQMNTVREAPAVQNKSYWKPQLNQIMDISLQDFKAEIQSKNSPSVILDVRSAGEFGLRNFSQFKNIQAAVINMPWQDFFDEKGLPRKSLVETLAQKNLNHESRLLVVSQDGVQSGAVTYALHALGFKRASNFSGGYQVWK